MTPKEAYKRTGGLLGFLYFMAESSKSINKILTSRLKEEPTEGVITVKRLPTKK